MLSDTQLLQIMPNLAQAKRALYLPALNQAMAACGVNSLLRTAAFAAQLAHESGEFRWMEEIWGPTAAQLGYEPPGAKAARLGNTQTGDGKRFKGRGPIQITGRFNYKRYGDLLKVDLIANPVQAAAPEVAFLTAGLFWKTNGLNELADAGQFVTITRRINGGENGLADRQKYYERAKAVLQATGFVVDAVMRGAKVRPIVIPEGVEPLARGAEVPVRSAPKSVVKKSPAKKATTAKAAFGKVAAKQTSAKQAVAKHSAARKKPA